MYTPGFRFSARALLPPSKVGIAPTTAPDDEATVTLWPTGDMFVKLIETAPALALSAVVLYFNWPSGLAVRLRLLLPVAGAVAGVEDVAGLVAVAVVAGLAGAEAAEELELELELPQPANTSNPTARARNETTGLERVFAAAVL